MKKTFSFGRSLSFSIFSKFERKKVGPCFAKRTLHTKCKGHFEETKSIDTHSKAYLPPSALLKRIEVFFQKKPIYFFTKNSEYDFFPTNEANLPQNAKEIVRFL